jgi:cyclopropane fatty-acyl-phospholipid synthase-like methyltransferase
MRVLDLGAGEGKNAAWLTSMGAEVEAVELSSHAIHNGKAAFGENVTWINDDAMKIWREPGSYDLVIAYGLLHCLPSAEIILKLMTRMRAWTAADGRCVVVAFNSRRQELEAAHPGFKPTLLAHSEYIQGFEGWAIEHESDRDLTETHPDLRIEHTHSMTRIVARRT